MNTTHGNNTNTTTSANQFKVLVVDDDIRLRDLLRRYLTEQGFNVVTAENAQAMNKLWLRERYDLLVLDLMLPGEDGLSICRRLRGAGDQTPSSCSPPRARTWTASSAWKWAPTTTCPSPSTRVNWWPASTPCCAARVRTNCRARRRKPGNL
jgi:hypothetical protein